MDASLLPEQNMYTSDDSLPIHLLQTALLYIKQAQYKEGIALLVQAAELTPNQSHLATTLNTMIESHKLYEHAQEILLQASKDFAKADAQQQAQVIALEKLLPPMQRVEESIAPSQPDEGSSHSHPFKLLPSLAPHSSPEMPDSIMVQAEEKTDLPALSITCFGHFEVKRLDQPVQLCSNRKGQAFMRFLITQVNYKATTDKLISVLWPEDELDIALRKMRVAISALRRSLNEGYVNDNGGGYILCKNGNYYFNPSIRLNTDVDEFLRLYRVGQSASRSARIFHYQQACHLYSGGYLPEDIYADWSFLQREQLSQVHLAMCRALAEYYLDEREYSNAIHWSTVILKENVCDESAHRLLMHAYAAQGRRSEALRQYHRCQQILFEELSVPPMAETEQLFQLIMQGHLSPSHLHNHQ